MNKEVIKYVDQVLEELDPEQANSFRAADEDVAAKEALVRGVKDEVAYERRMQEALLKDMRVAYGSNNQSASAKPQRGGR